jgi:hypothetical protein
MHLSLNENQIWTARIRVPGSTMHIGFRSPPAFLPLSGGGGGPESRAHLFNDYDRSTYINGAQGNSRPPPTFLPLSGGGGGPESRTHLFDGCDWSAQINDAQAIQTSSIFLRLINVGPPFMSQHLTICSPLTTYHVSRSLP